MVVPLREELDSTDLRLGHVTGADPAEERLHYTAVDGRSETIKYDQLIVSLGSVSRVLPIPGLAEHGLGFKTISEAIALRNRALFNLEIAGDREHPRDGAERDDQLVVLDRLVASVDRRVVEFVPRPGWHRSHARAGGLWSRAPRAAARPRGAARACPTPRPGAAACRAGSSRR